MAGPGGRILPGAKLEVTGPGLHQRIRVQPLLWTAERQEEFERRVVLYCTGFSGWRAAYCGR